jgi:hypothetical protein
MEECLMDGLIDTVKLLPYLLVTFIILELLEHKLSKKNEKILTKNKKYGPILGGLLGSLPQCGFSAMASNLFSSRVITVGTLVAIFLSTSDEMLPIMLSEQTDIMILLRIIGFKVIIGIIVGFIVDALWKRKEEHNHIHELCENDNCHCGKDGIIVSSLKHTIKIGFFILVVNLLLNTVIYKVGEDNLKELLLNKNIFTYFIASLIGLIPNCASSVIMTELYLSDLLTTGNLLAGLLTGSGLGILLLFKTNKNLKENLKILSIIYFVGVIIGILVDLVI